MAWKGLKRLKKGLPGRLPCFMRVVVAMVPVARCLWCHIVAYARWCPLVSVWRGLYPSLYNGMPNGSVAHVRQGYAPGVRCPAGALASANHILPAINCYWCCRVTRVMMFAAVNLSGDGCWCQRAMIVCGYDCVWLCWCVAMIVCGWCQYVRLIPVCACVIWCYEKGLLTYYRYLVIKKFFTYRTDPPIEVFILCYRMLRLGKGTP